jgi:trk system potassium uptake protein TrkA
MYVIVAGGGKVGANVARSLINMGHEVTLVEQSRERFERLEEEFGHQVLIGDATEIHTLERAGINRPPDLLLAVTGDDEDNLVICQIAREGYGVEKVIARVNDPRNQAHFDLLGITQTVCAVSNIMGLVEHEVPEHGLVRMLELKKENLEIVEVQIDRDSPVAGKRVAGLSLPDGSRLISVMRNGQAEIAVGSTVLRPGDQVLAILQPGKEDELRRALLSKKERTAAEA